MKFSLWTKYGAQNSKPVFDAFAHSLKNEGHTVVYNEPGADKDVIWSVLWKGKMAPNKAIFNSSTIVLEVGGIKRGTTWKVAIGGIDRHAMFPRPDHGDERAKKLGLKADLWCPNTKGPVVICCQNYNSFQWNGKPSIEQWLENTIIEIQQYTKRDILIRAHPRSTISDISKKFKNVQYSVPTKIPRSYDDYDFNPKTAWAVVNASSGPGVQAAIKGIPVFVENASLAWDVGNHNFSTIEKPEMPDRTEWINHLAYTEWTISEIAAGEPLKRLTDYL
jgi:hypothetical protein